MPCSAQLVAIDMHDEVVFVVLFSEFEFNDRGISFADSLENHPGGLHVGLHPLLLFGVEVHEAADAAPKHIEPSAVVDIVPVFLLICEENVVGLVVMHEVKGN